MDRREFVTGTVAFAATRRVGRQPRVVGSDHVQSVESAIQRLEQQDATVGGGNLCDDAVRLRWQVEQWLDHASFSATTGEALRSQLGELSAWTGWLTFDSGRFAEAGHYLQDTLVQARLADDPALEVRAFSYMCLLLARSQRPRVSLQSAEAALRLAQGWATPRLLALLHLRAAHAHALLGEATGFDREMAKAAAQLDRGSHPDDPLYVEFVSPQEAIGIAGISHLALGRPERATRAFREITDNPDPARPRNVTFYTVRLAEALAQQGDIAQASEVAAGQVPVVAALESPRTARRLGDVRQAIDPHLATVPAAREFADVYDHAFAVQ